MPPSQLPMTPRGMNTGRLASRSQRNPSLLKVKWTSIVSACEGSPRYPFSPHLLKTCSSPRYTPWQTTTSMP